MGEVIDFNRFKKNRNLDSAIESQNTDIPSLIKEHSTKINELSEQVNSILNDFKVGIEALDDVRIMAEKESDRTKVLIELSEYLMEYFKTHIPTIEEQAMYNKLFQTKDEQAIAKLKGLVQILKYNKELNE